MKAQRNRNRKDKETADDFDAGFKENLFRDKAKFGAAKGKNDKNQLFQEMKKWDIELERLEKEEASLKKSLKEINNRISGIIHKKEVVKSVSDIGLRESKEKKKIEINNEKISKAVNRVKSEKRRNLLVN